MEHYLAIYSDVTVIVNCDGFFQGANPTSPGLAGISCHPSFSILESDIPDSGHNEKQVV